MDTQKLLSRLRRCVTDYKMIKEGDKIAVGLSGGKDSLALLKLLAEYRRFSPERFELVAITVDLGFNGQVGNYDKIKAFCQEIDVPYFIEYTQIGEIIFDARKETNPCALCSRMRKGALYDVVTREGCNKVALGHHADDLIDTFLLSMFYEGRLSTFAPKSYLSKTDLVMIRPMLYLKEWELRSFTKDMPVEKSKCPADKVTKREEVKNIIATLGENIPDVREKIFTALTHPERYNLFDRYAKEIDKF